MLSHLPSTLNLKLTDSRTLATVVFIASLGVQFQILDPRLVVFDSAYLWKFPPQIWRAATSFLVAGSGINLLFDTYFFYHYMCQLEVGHPRFPRKADLIWYLMVVGGIILVSLVASFPTRDVFLCPSSICPDSALPLQLSRFLKMREITPACRVDPSFANSGDLGCRHGGSLWMTRVILYSHRVCL